MDSDSMARVLRLWGEPESRAKVVASWMDIECSTPEAVEFLADAGWHGLTYEFRPDDFEFDDQKSFGELGVGFGYEFADERLDPEPWARIKEAERGFGKGVHEWDGLDRLIAYAVAEVVQRAAQVLMIARETTSEVAL